MAQAKREEIGKFLGDAAPGVQRTLSSPESHETATAP
jgi:hypothetical protein